MPKLLKSFVRSFLERAGYHVSCKSHFGYEPFADFSTLLSSCPKPIVCDVGANTGQFAAQLICAVPSARVYSFEPDPATFLHLQATARTHPAITPVNLALGSTVGRSNFHVNRGSPTNSLLAKSPASNRYVTDGGMDLEKIISVETGRLDDFATTSGFDSVDLLKIDTQGYDLEVLRGTEKLISRHRVRAVFCEVLFKELYLGQAYFHEISDHLHARGLRFGGFYSPCRDLATREYVYADALYVDPLFQSAN